MSIMPEDDTIYRKGMRISDLDRVVANDLYDHDLLVLSIQRLERDEDGEEVIKKTVAITLGELKKYLFAPKISSGFTPETFKQCLEDADSVKKQALANAKEALRRGFESNGCIVETD